VYFVLYGVTVEGDEFFNLNKTYTLPKKQHYLIVIKFVKLGQVNVLTTRGGILMKFIKKAGLLIDSIFENFTLISLVGLIFVVTTQVMTRKLFNFVFFWSEEITLLLLAWFAFMAIAIGVREYIHLGIDSFTNLFGKAFNKFWDKVISLSLFAFGLYLVVQGWNFTVLMLDSTLPATKLPSSVTYLAMPITGVMICGYSFLQLFKINTTRHEGIEEGM
jgi:TRAP-type transport system small permease protein